MVHTYNNYKRQSIIIFHTVFKNISPSADDSETVILGSDSNIKCLVRLRFCASVNPVLLKLPDKTTQAKYVYFARVVYYYYYYMGVFFFYEFVA